MRTFPFPETFEVDITNTKKLLEGERGQIIAQKDVIVSIFFASLVKSTKKKNFASSVSGYLFTLHVTCAELFTDHILTNHTLLLVAQILIQKDRMNQ